MASLFRLAFYLFLFYVAVRASAALFRRASALGDKKKQRGGKGPPPAGADIEDAQWEEIDEKPPTPS